MELAVSNSQKMLDEKKISITLELIVGGPTGTKLSELPDAAREAAAKIAELDKDAGKSLTFVFDDQVSQTVADHIIKHYGSHAERKMRIIEARYPSLYHDYELGTYDPSYQLRNMGGLESANIRIEPHQMGEDEAEAPERDSRDDLQEVLKILALVREDLEKKIAAERQKEASRFSMISTVTLPMGGLSGADWGLQVTLGIPVTEIPSVIRNLSKQTHKQLFSNPESWNTVSKEELESRLGQEPELLGQIRGMADRDSCLVGLSEIISAYRRGIDNAAHAGPKHTMRLVNKNPLDQVILSIEGLTQEAKRRLLDVCVDTIVSGKDGLDWKWEGARLEVSEWSEKMKADSPVDLVSVYDGAYRYGQIGQLSSLNENAEGVRQIPVFEFRDLSNIKVNRLKDLFRAVADNCDRED